MNWQKWLTIECQVAKNGGQEVHNKHGKKGDIWNHLHPFLWSTENKDKRIWKIKNMLLNLKTGVNTKVFIGTSLSIRVEQSWPTKITPGSYADLQ